ncbi:MAG: glycine cleavage system protein GcvH [Fibrobacterales bacterium]
MSEIRDGLKYSEDHEWILVEGDVVTIGVTDHAQSELGDIIFVELPEVDDEVSKGDSIGTIEAVKTVADIYCPVNGTVVEANEALADKAESMNTAPYGDGWIVKIKISDPAELDELMSAEDYKNHIS